MTAQVGCSLVASVALVIAVATTGCARVSGDAAAEVVERYYDALTRSDVSAACALMTDAQRNGFEGGTCEEVMRFVLETDGPPGVWKLQPRGERVAATGDRQTVELRYQVAYRAGPRVDILTLVGTAGQPESFRIDEIARQEIVVGE